MLHFVLYLHRNNAAKIQMQNTQETKNVHKTPAEATQAGRKLVDVTAVFQDLDRIVRHDACFYETEQTVPRYINQNILAPYIRFREEFKTKTENEAPPLERILELFLENHAFEQIPDNYREREIA